jgi:hypothetical protein
MHIQHCKKKYAQTCVSNESFQNYFFEYQKRKKKSNARACLSLLIKLKLRNIEDRGYLFVKLNKQYFQNI